jgi:ribonuclease P protein component
MKFSRQSRLLKPAEFKNVFQKPIRSGDDCFRVMARVNGIRVHRLGIAVSKKACSLAVGRNRIKRIIRESFRNRMLVSGQDNTLDIVVLPNAVAANLTNKELDQSLSSHWQRLIRKAESRTRGNQPDQKRTDR